jgi:hypothetical protein
LFNRPNNVTWVPMNLKLSITFPLPLHFLFLRKNSRLNTQNTYSQFSYITALSFDLLISQFIIKQTVTQLLIKRCSNRSIVLYSYTETQRPTYFLCDCRLHDIRRFECLELLTWVLEKPTVVQLIKNLPTFHFITTFTRAFYRSLSWVRLGISRNLWFKAMSSQSSNHSCYRTCRLNWTLHSQCTSEDWWAEAFHISDTRHVQAGPSGFLHVARVHFISLLMG